MLDSFFMVIHFLRQWPPVGLWFCGWGRCRRLKLLQNGAEPLPAFRAAENCFEFLKGRVGQTILLATLSSIPVSPQLMHS